MKFDPVNYIKNAEHMTEQLIDAPDEEMIKDFTEKVLGGIMARKNVPRQFAGQRLRHRQSMAARTNHSLNQSVDFKSMDNGTSSKYRIVQNFNQTTKYIVQKSSSPPQQYDRTQIFSAEIPKRSHIKSQNSSQMGFNIPVPQT